MDTTSTTAGNDQQTGDATASTTAADSTQTATDQQTAQTSDNLDSSKSTDSTTAGGDTEATDTSKDGGDASAYKFDDDIDDWIDKRKLPKPNNDEERQALQEQRNSQREFTREQQAKKDAEALTNTLSDAKAATSTDADDDTLDPLEKRQNALEARYEAERTTRLQSEFYQTNKVTPEEHKAILDIYKEKTDRPSTPEAKNAAVNYWSSVDALPDLLDQAKARIVLATDTSDVADEAARKEREKIAQESQANSTGRNARTTQTSDKSAEAERTKRQLELYS